MRTMRGALLALAIGIIVGVGATLQFGMPGRKEAAVAAPATKPAIASAAASNAPSAAPNNPAPAVAAPVTGAVTVVPDFASLAERLSPVGGQHLDAGAAQGRVRYATLPRPRSAGSAMAVRRRRPARFHRAVRAILRTGTEAASAAAAQPGIGLRHRHRRLHPHQQPRRRERRRDHRPARQRGGVQGDARRQRPEDRLGAAQDRRREGAHRGRARRLRQAARRRMGDGDRQPVRSRSHRDLGHRQRQGSLHRRRATTTTTSRPTPPSIRATRAGRCSTCVARSSASTPPSSAAPAATSASASRSRSIWRRSSFRSCGRRAR